MKTKKRAITLEEVKEKVIPLLKGYNAERISIFGSLARGEYSPGSDIDILVKFKEPISLMDHAGIEIELSDILGTRVDIVTEEGLHPYLEENVKEEEKVILQ